MMKIQKRNPFAGRRKFVTYSYFKMRDEANPFFYAPVLVVSWKSESNIHEDKRKSYRRCSLVELYLLEEFHCTEQFRRNGNTGLLKVGCYNHWFRMHRTAQCASVALNKANRNIRRTGGQRCKVRAVWPRIATFWRSVWDYTRAKGCVCRGNLCILIESSLESWKTSDKLTDVAQSEKRTGIIGQNGGRVYLTEGLADLCLASKIGFCRNTHIERYLDQPCDLVRRYQIISNLKNCIFREMCQMWETMSSVLSFDILANIWQDWS